jgi:hypothetical protein
LTLSRNTPGATALEGATVAAALENTPAAVGVPAHVHVTSPWRVDDPRHMCQALPTASQPSGVGGGGVRLGNPPGRIEYSTAHLQNPYHTLECSSARATNHSRSVEYSTTELHSLPRSGAYSAAAPRTPPRKVECSTAGRKPALGECKVAAGASIAAPAQFAKAQKAGYDEAQRDGTQGGNPGREPYHNRCYNCGKPGHFQTQCKEPRKVKRAGRGSRAGQPLLESAGKTPRPGP